ncbi:MAG TPA: hypothetical protein VEU06_06300, partial [Micropepsaceae bacterium]|nr:hypothetical protein [Micropepsaceae bacterium]
VRAVTSGDHYEVAFTAPHSARPAVEAAARETGVSLTEIGTVQAGQGVQLMDQGQPVAVGRPGYTHR